MHGKNSGNYSELDEYLKEHPDFWKNMKTESDAVTATSLSSKTKTKMSKSTTTKTSTSTVIGKIIYAIRQLNEPGLKGSSRQSILKYIKSEFNNYDHTTALKTAFKKAVTGVDKILIQNGQSFRVIGDPIIESEQQQTKSTTRTKMNKKLSNHKISTQAKISSQKSSKKQNKNKENGVTGAGGAGDDGTTTGASVVGGDGDEDVFYDAVQELNE